MRYGGRFNLRDQNMDRHAGTMMKEKSDILDAIAEFNLSYLLLAQRMLLDDRERGKSMLGVSDAMASRICSLTPAEIEVLADSSELVCQLRADATPGRA
ncbi:flagellar transcriptional regulator FlhD [Paraburkholderia sediminicola]|uniref:flagellar transcriptional regulator FlhD n=1 Tax=Paraburkholderia sediminicola TaxID=458836 RepID=UPI0038B8CE0A